MIGLKIALFFGCLTLVAGRTITVQRTSLSLTEESEDAVALNDILQTFLGISDVTSVEKYDEIVQGCSKGKCQYCKKSFGLEACFVATLGTNSIVLEVTLNKKVVFKTDVKVPNPPEVCKKSIPGIPFVKDVCLKVTNINLKEASGCVSISAKIKFQKFSVKKCFKIPTADDVIEATEENMAGLDNEVTEDMQDDNSLKFEPIFNSS